MNKKIIAIAIATAMAAPAAMAEVSVSGLAKWGLVGGDTNAKNQIISGDTGSRFIVKGSQKTSGGKAFAVVDVNLSTNDANALPGSTRGGSFVGLSGSFGTITGGNQPSALKGAVGKHDLFADSPSDQNNVGVYNEQHKGNGIKYATKMGGAKVSLSYNLESDAATTYTTAAVDVKAGPALITLGVHSGSSTHAIKSTSYLGASMKFGAAKVIVQYQDEKAKNGDKDTVVGLGASMKAGPGVVKFKYMINDKKVGTADKTQTSLGYDMGLGKGVGLGFHYTMVDNQTAKDTGQYGVGIGVKF